MSLPLGDPPNGGNINQMHFISIWQQIVVGISLLKQHLWLFHMSALNDWLLECPLPSHLASFLVNVSGTSQLRAVSALQCPRLCLVISPVGLLNPNYLTFHWARREESQDGRGTRWEMKNFNPAVRKRPNVGASLGFSFFFLVKGLQFQAHSCLPILCFMLVS